MNEDKKQKIEKEVKQIGLDVFIGSLIIALIAGMAAGIFIAP